jgi:hypothetical protein
MRSKSLGTGQVDLQRMLDTAAAFFLAGERCAPALKFGVYGEHTLDAPRIVSYALAVEIALKLLVRLAGTACEGHSIKHLLDNLPDETRAHLNWVEDCADEIESYFVHWRYPYESEFLVGDCDNPRRAFIVCYHEIRRQKPELLSVFKRNWGSFDPDWQWAWPEKEFAVFEMPSP